MQHNRRIIYLVGFLFSVPIALTAYINSSFLSTFIDKELIGIIYAMGSLSSILALLIAPHVFKKIGGYKFLIIIALLEVLSLFTLSMVKHAWSAIGIFILYFTLNTLVIFSLDELLEIFSKDSTTGKTRGIYLAICSLAWIIAQLVTGTILGKFDFKIMYLTSFGIMTLFLLVSFFNLKNIPDPKYDEIKTIKYIKEFFKNKNLLHAYSMSFLLHFFYCWMVIYTPIYLSIHLGFAWKEIGIIFAIMLLPFFLIPFPLGRYGDKIGERTMLMLGFTIASIATLSLFFIKEHKVFIWALALFITRIGASSIEVMCDTYFFKHIKAKSDQFVGVYRSASPIAYIIGPLLASIIFIFIPSFNFIYIILGTLMLAGVYIASTIKKSDI